MYEDSYAEELDRQSERSNAVGSKMRGGMSQHTEELDTHVAHSKGVHRIMIDGVEIHAPQCANGSIISIDESVPITSAQVDYMSNNFPIRKDTLNTMFKMQYELQKFLGTDFKGLPLSEAVKLIKEHSLMATIELGEMLNELPFLKAWKNYDTMTAREVDVAMAKAREEYIDIVHFMLNVGLLLGFDGLDVFKAYKAKNQENYDRQKNKWNEGTHYTYKE